MHRDSEHGGAMLVMLIVITALTAGAVTLASIQRMESHSAGLSRETSASLYCAEAGLATARSAVGSSYSQWNTALAAGGEPSWLAALDHDIDDNGTRDFELSLRDNDDEIGASDAGHDNDLAVYVVSTCVKYPDTAVTVAELVRYSGGGSCYESQLGGCGGNNNAN